MQKEKVERIKQKVINKVRKEYKEFVSKCLEEGEWYIFENSLKVTFFKEIFIYIQNAIVCDYCYVEMYRMNFILEELWARYLKHEIMRAEKDYFAQLLDLHLKNIKRLNDRNK